MVNKGCIKCQPAKQLATRYVMMPVNTPRAIPPLQKPAIISQAGMGETRISSKLRLTMRAPKNELVTLA